MDLYLIRHADALEFGQSGINSDAERPLSDLGRKQSDFLGENLQKRGILFDQVVTSPLLRARQTAEIVMGKLGGPAPGLHVSDALVPEADPKSLTSAFSTIHGRRIGLFGHMPNIARLTAWLIGSKNAQINFTKAAIACIGCDATVRKGAGALLWFVTQEWLE